MQNPEDVIEPRSEYGNLPPERFDLASEVRSATDKRMADHLKSCEMAKQLKEEGIVVMTTCVARHWGTSWYAWNDRTWPDGPQGFGKTEAEAIENFVEQIAEEQS